jgi:hypothetical protein
MADDIAKKRANASRDHASRERAVKLSKEALEALGKEDLLYAHHGAVFARPPDAYERLADFFEKFLEGV